MTNGLTAGIILKYQERRGEIKTIGEYKALGRELRGEYGLTDREAIDLLNGHNEIEILDRHSTLKVN